MFSYAFYITNSKQLSEEVTMIAEVDVFISNYTLVDPEVYQLWVDGYSSSEAVAVLQQESALKQPGTTVELIASDVLNHYRTYSLLERLLHNPLKLAEQLAFQIEPQTKQLLIEKYYEFDDSVIRELLGKKLSSRHRKDLDEVSEKTNVSLKSCRRQFDNVKRVFKTVEEMQGSVVQNIRSLFLLPDELAKRYGAVVFIACMRFETSKRKLQHMTFADFYHCSSAIMTSWTYQENSADYDDTDLDREFLLDLREFRILLDKEKELKHLVSHRLKPKLLERAYQELESNFRMYSRALIGLACNLHRTRELRCMFLELVERCIEPWRQISWTETDLSNFLSAYTSCAIEMDVFREATVKSAWERYMTVISTCVMRIFKTY
ncbi:acidic fibroblast growth factor intracellular-binding protein [Lycorma delicatula]|uniref:acidic fibroblast growth factor intracellular-binding protein n=1 Tax=Lycorma delicatula TaxID=130591 RepID=UPI003F50E6EE